MKKTLTYLSLLSLSTFSNYADTIPQAILPEKHRAFLDQYCMDCHDADTEKGEVNLEDLPFKIETIPQAELWQDVLATLNSGEMPPEKKKQPSNDEKASFLEDLSNTMVTARRILSDSGGKITMRRLNRRDYQNSLESLLGVKLDLEQLPDDGGSSDFDTVGASLFMSSDKFEQYLKLGRKALDEFYINKETQNAKTFLVRVEPEKTLNPALKERVNSLEVILQNYQALNKEVERVGALPENKDFMEKLKKKHRNNARQYYTYLKELKGAPNPKDFGFKSFEGAAKNNSNTKQYAYHKHYSELPHNDQGTYLQLNYASSRITIAPHRKVKMPNGIYKLRIRAGATDTSPPYRRFLEVGHPGGPIDERGQLDGFPLKALHVTGSLKEPQIIETELHVNSDTARKFAIRERQPTSWGQLRKIFYAEQKRNGYGHEPAIWVDWVELEGPFPSKDSESPFSRILTKHSTDQEQSDSEKARNILNDFAIAAYRDNKPRPEFIDSLINLFNKRMLIDKDFDIAIRTPLSIILASPQFLFIKEPGQEGKPSSIDNRELAVRLSYFLWSSPPDETLLRLAQNGKLSQLEILREQVNRLIQDPRARNFASGLLHQWLHMDRLDFFQFDAREYREFDENTRTAAREEVYQSFLYLLKSKDDGELSHLLKSDYVFINSLLASHYGIPGVEGNYYRRVSLPENSPRGGLLGMAAIHAMGSDGKVSSPVERGSWVLRYLLNDPPPPAPANVPQLSRHEGKKLTKREVLMAHQEEPQCASCHRKIDPIGFGLENFDATGKWRLNAKHEITTQNRKGVIDASGAFHKGPKFSDYFELRDIIYSKKDDFARSFTEALIEYALGRPFAFTDEDLAQDIIEKAQSKGETLSEFIHAIVASPAFHTK